MCSVITIGIAPPPWQLTQHTGLQKLHTTSAYTLSLHDALPILLAYVAVFLVLRGFIVVEGWRVQWAPRQELPTIPQSNTLAYKMLA